MAKIIFLGTSGAIASKERDNTSLLFLTDSGEKFLIDCPGSPLKKLSHAGIDYREISRLVLTHTHVDHIYGIPSLLHSQYKLRNKMHIFASQECLLLIRGLIAFHKLDDTNRFPVLSFHTIPSDREQFTFFDNEETTLAAFPVKHNPESIGIKIIVKNNSVSCVYSGDTGFSKSIIRIATGADYLIHDCACPSRLAKGLEEMHTSSLTLGEIARECQAKTVVPIHFLTELDFEMDEVLYEIRKNFSGNIIIPSDFDCLELTPQPV